VEGLISEIMASYWVNFAATGDRNGKGPAWPTFDTKSDRLMGFGDKVEVTPVPHKPSLDFLDAYFEKERKSPMVN
jgi:carboxylesterase type B